MMLILICLVILNLTIFTLSISTNNNNNNSITSQIIPVPNSSTESPSLPFNSSNSSLPSFPPSNISWICPSISTSQTSCSCDLPYTLRCYGSSSLSLNEIGITLKSLRPNEEVSLLDITLKDVNRLDEEVLKDVRVHGVVVSAQLTFLSPFAFKSLLGPLQALGLPGNKLRRIPKDSLKEIKELQVLDLSKNRIEKLETGDLKVIPNLTFLDLSYNRLSSIQPDSLPLILKELRLSNNLFKSFSFPLPFNLENLDLSSNFFTGVLDCFPLIPFLKTLKLSHNAFTKVKHSAFKSFSFSNNKSQSLLFNYNHNSNDTFSFKLQSLDLSHNNIDVLEQKAFALLPLKYLDLSHNRIVVLGNSLEGLKFLEELNLSFNYLRVVTSDLFLPTLKSLDLGCNDIASVRLQDNLEDTDETTEGSVEQIVNEQVNIEKEINVEKETNLVKDLERVKKHSMFVNTEEVSKKRNILNRYSVPEEHPLKINFKRNINLDHNSFKQSSKQYQHIKKILPITDYSVKNIPQNNKNLINLNELDLDEEYPSEESINLESNHPLNFQNSDNFSKYYSNDYQTSLNLHNSEHNNFKSKIDDDTLLNEYSNTVINPVQNFNLLNILKTKNPFPLIQHLSLLSNPLTCDCLLRPFALWLKRSALPMKDKKTAVCATPPQLENAAVYEIEDSDFMCDKENDDEKQKEEEIESKNISLSFSSYNFHLNNLTTIWKLMGKSNFHHFKCESFLIYRHLPSGDEELLLHLHLNECIIDILEVSVSVNVSIFDVIQQDRNDVRICIVLLEKDDNEEEIMKTERLEKKDKRQGRKQKRQMSDVIVGCSDVIKLKETSTTFNTNITDELSNASLNLNDGKNSESTNELKENDENKLNMRNEKIIVNGKSDTVIKTNNATKTKSSILKNNTEFEKTTNFEIENITFNIKTISLTTNSSVLKSTLAENITTDVTTNVNETTNVLLLVVIVTIAIIIIVIVHSKQQQLQQKQLQLQQQNLQRRLYVKLEVTTVL